MKDYRKSKQNEGMHVLIVLFAKAIVHFQPKFLKLFF